MYQLFDAATSLEFRPRGTVPPLSRAIDSALSAYFAGRLGLTDLEFADPPTLEPTGWEAYVYRFCLRGDGRLPMSFARPLVLRQYAGPKGLPRARREFAVQTHAHGQGYPVPEPLLLEEDSRRLGGPFLIMEQVPGQTLLERLRGNWTCCLEVPGQLARAHARLHALTTCGLPSAGGSFLARHLDGLRRAIRTHDLSGLKAGYRWLDAHRPAETAAPRLLHLDFHPCNLIAREGGECVVFDWSEADVGDRHADLATTLLLLRYAPVEGLGRCERLLAPVTRWLMTRRYRRAYNRINPIDPGRLHYYLAWACLQRLAKYGAWLRAGPQSNGSKPGAVRRVTPAHVRDLERCFVELTGVAACRLLLAPLSRSER